MNEFIIELKALLKKHNASIGFEVGEGSDTYGIYEEGLILEILEKDNLNKTKEKKKFNDWFITCYDL